MRGHEIAPCGPRERQAFRLTRHARERTDARGFRWQAIRAALEFGRVIHVRGAEVHALGRKEVIRLRRHGIDLRIFEGMVVVCNPKSGFIMTAYRNRDFRKLRPRRQRPRWKAAFDRVQW